MLEYYSQRSAGVSGHVQEWFAYPKAPLYVVSNDRFMSRLASEAGKQCDKNVCIIPAYSQLEANAVYNYVQSRSDQNNVRINMNPPRERDRVLYSMPLGWVSLALERQTMGNREAIIADHFKRAGGLSGKELRELHQHAINRHHTCTECYFCICGYELSFRDARKLSDAELQRHYSACARNGCKCNGYDFTCICGRVIKERQSAEGYAFAADMIYDRR